MPGTLQLTMLVILASCRLASSETNPPAPPRAAPPRAAPPRAAPPRDLPPPSLDLPPPTRTEHGPLEYLYWEPGARLARLPSETTESLAARVLGSSRVVKLIGARRGIDTFSYDHSTPEKNMITFKQAMIVRGQSIPVDEHWATVELAGDNLVYVGAGFRAGITVPDQPIRLDEKQAEQRAITAFDQKFRTRGRATDHQHRGLHVAADANTLAYWIHVEEPKDPTSAYMFQIDAFSGSVVRSYSPVRH